MFNRRPQWKPAPSLTSERSPSCTAGSCCSLGSTRRRTLQVPEGQTVSAIVHTQYTRKALVTRTHLHGTRVRTAVSGRGRSRQSCTDKQCTCRTQSPNHPITHSPITHSPTMSVADHEVRHDSAKHVRRVRVVVSAPPPMRRQARDHLHGHLAPPLLPHVSVLIPEPQQLVVRHVVRINLASGKRPSITSVPCCQRRVGVLKLVRRRLLGSLPASCVLFERRNVLGSSASDTSESASPNKGDERVRTTTRDGQKPQQRTHHPPLAAEDTEPTQSTPLRRCRDH